MTLKCKTGIAKSKRNNHFEKSSGPCAGNFLISCWVKKPFLKQF